MTSIRALTSIQKIRNLSSSREFSGGRIIFNKTSQVQTSIGAVNGLSEKCVKMSNQPVGPGASKDSEYKNPEYYCYHKNSFSEAEIEMLKYRCPQPTNKQPYVVKQ